MSDKIFINYRRGEDSGFAQALFIRLEQTFSSSNLFMDVDSIAPGEDFVRRLESQIAQCDVLLAIIGKGWIDATNERGGRRLEDPDDFVRIEIASALKQNKRVIPVLLHEATMPRPEQLAPELRPLARRHAVRLTHERFRVDTEGLIKALQRAVGDTAAAPRSEPPGAIAPSVAPAVAGISLIRDPDTPDQTSVPVGAEVTRVKQKANQKLGIAAGIEKLAERYEAMNFGVISLLSAFLLVFGSYLAGVLDVEYTALHKQVGFGWAPNWSFNYLVLFVAYNCLLCAFANRIREILANFSRQGGVISADGAVITTNILWFHYRDNLKGISPILWVLSLGVPFVCANQWYNDCYQPLHQNLFLGNSVDWTNIAVVQPETTTINAEVLFTGVAYIYMAVSLWIYLFVLLYAAAFSWYISRLSRGISGLRLVVHSRDLHEIFSDISLRVFIFAFLGFISAFTMRIQTAYLQTTDPDVFRFMFSWELGLFSHENIPSAQPIIPHEGSAAPPWPSWPVFIYAAVMFGFALSMLRTAYNAVTAYHHAHIDPEERGEEEIHRARSDSFLRSVTPDFGHWMIISLLMLASMVRPTVGSFFVGALTYAASLLALRQLKPTIWSARDR